MLTTPSKAQTGWGTRYAAQTYFAQCDFSCGPANTKPYAHSLLARSQDVFPHALDGLPDPRLSLCPPLLLSLVLGPGRLLQLQVQWAQCE